MKKTFIALAMCVTLAFSSNSTALAACEWSASASTTDEQKLYVEGEALAIVRGDVQLQSPGKAERIAQVSAEAIEDAIGDWNSRDRKSVV